MFRTNGFFPDLGIFTFFPTFFQACLVTCDSIIQSRVYDLLGGNHLYRHFKFSVVGFGLFTPITPLGFGGYLKLDSKKLTLCDPSRHFCDCEKMAKSGIFRLCHFFMIS